MNEWTIQFTDETKGLIAPFILEHFNLVIWILMFGGKGGGDEGYLRVLGLLDKKMGLSPKANAM